MRGALFLALSLSLSLSLSLALTEATDPLIDKAADRGQGGAVVALKRVPLGAGDDDRAGNGVPVAALREVSGEVVSLSMERVEPLTL